MIKRCCNTSVPFVLELVFFIDTKHAAESDHSALDVDETGA